MERVRRLPLLLAGAFRALLPPLPPLLLLVVVVVPAGAAALQEPEAAREAARRPDLLRMAGEVKKDVERLRGWEFREPVKKGVYTEEELRAFIQKKIFEEEYGGGKLERIQAFLRMVGLLPAGTDLAATYTDVLLNQVGGFYDPSSRAFYMLRREGVQLPEAMERMLIAHELTHALDDQYLDLDRVMRLRERSQDWSLAVGAMVEGSATILMTRYMTEMMRRGDLDVGQMQEVMRAEAERSRVFMEAPPYFTTLVATYMVGMHFLLRGRPPAVAVAEGFEGIVEDLERAAADPPRSTEQVLHPRKYWDEEHRDEPVVVEDGDVQRLLAAQGLGVEHRDTVGELLCAILTTRPDRRLNPALLAMPSYWTHAAAQGWGGDRFYLLARRAQGDGAEGEGEGGEHEAAKGPYLGLWVTLWDTASDLEEFVAAYERHRPDPSRRRFALGAMGEVFLYGWGEEEAEAFQGAFLAAPPAFRKGEEAWVPGGR